MIHLHSSQTNFMQIGLATSEEIQNWSERSYFLDGQFLEIGEVKKADTINYRTFKPEKDGLFCERIFGPVNDWLCSCGQWSGMPQSNENLSTALESTAHRSKRKNGAPTKLWNVLRGTLRSRSKVPEILFDSKTWPKAFIRGPYASETQTRDDFFDGSSRSQTEVSSRTKCLICPNCQVEITLSRIRRYRMGYISLACPVTHIWFLNSRPNIFSVLMKMPTKYVKKINYYKGYSPSQKNVLNPCLGPGGDFFDTEWEFLHRWFGAGLNEGLRRMIAFKASLPSKVGFQFIHGKRQGVPLKNEATNRPFSEYPVWLENTGAHAFRHHFQNRNWAKEFQKLQYELRQSPCLIFGSTLHKESGYALALEHRSTKQSLGQGRSLLGTQNSDLGEESKKTFEIGIGSALDQEYEQHINFLLKRRKKRVRKLKLLNILRTAGHLSSAFAPGFEESTENQTQLFAAGVSDRSSGIPSQGWGILKKEAPFIFTNIPVLPPELRPIVQLNAGQLASSDVNDLYRRVISRNNRLKYYLTSCGPHLVEFLVRSEQHLVQLSVDALFENGKTSGMLRIGKERSFEGSRDSSGRKQIYKSLSDRIGGKQGRFRQNLLGKRVDYSGRSVIVVGPKLKLNECGLPIEMATELFQAFLIRHILELQLAKTIRGAKNILRYNQPLTRQLLQNVVQSHPILLNRAPTLHRLGIQAFQPKLVSGRAIQLHPLVCTAFNADFDGDQMAVHVPLSAKARVEARLLMLANTNWFSPATGQPSILPSQDMVLGFYYLTIENPKLLGKTTKTHSLSSSCLQQSPRFPIFSSLTDVIQAYESDSLSIHSQIWVKLEGTSFIHETGAQPLEKENTKGSSFQGTIKQNFKTRPLVSGAANTAAPPYRKNSSSSSGARQKQFCISNSGSLRGGFAWEPRDTNSLSSKPGLPERIKEITRDSQTYSAYADSSGRPGKNLDEPLFIRLSNSGRALKVFSSYKWNEDSHENRTNICIRTTPGRILVNKLIFDFQTRVFSE